MSDHVGEVYCTYSPAPKIPKGAKGQPLPCGGLAAGTLAAAMAHCGATYTIPWWGDKWTANLKNAGYVIGFIDSTNANRHWHLDWDPVKGLHLNWEDKSKFPATKVVHKVSNLGIALAPALQVINNGIDETNPISLPDTRCSAERNQHMIWIAWSRAALNAGSVPTTEEKKTICKARFGHHDENYWSQVVDDLGNNFHDWLNDTK